MPKTYNQLYLDTRRRFIESGISSPSLEARLITAYAAGKTTEKLFRDMQLYATNSIELELEDLVSRRLDGEPTAYLTGAWEFYGLPLAITPDVLIPRMDTEVLAEAAIKYLKKTNSSARVLDLCSGSGCIGCAVAHNVPGAKLVMVDKSPYALEVCRRNVRLNRLEGRVTYMEADATKPPPMLIGSFELIVCNPPYIPTGDLRTLDTSVRDFEPLLALDGGDDGLDFYRTILRQWRTALRDSGMIMLEVGINQAEAVKKLMRLNGFRGIGSIEDTGGIERVIYGHV